MIQSIPAALPFPSSGHSMWPVPRRIATICLLGTACVLVAGPVGAQEANLADGPRVDRLVVQPGELSMRVGERASFSVRALDARGNPLNPVITARGSRGGISIEDGQVVGVGVGTHRLVLQVMLPPGVDGEPASVTIPVEVRWPEIDRVEIDPVEGRLYAGTDVRYAVRALHADGSERPGPEVTWSISDRAVASVDPFGRVAAHDEGTVTIRAEVEGVVGEREERVEPFPVTEIRVEADRERVRTGDVVLFRAEARSDDGGVVEDAPVTWTYIYMPDDSIAEPGAAAAVRDGRFVAQFPGEYTVRASAGPVSGFRTIRVDSRQVVRRIEVLGQGRVSHRRTSDFWVFEGVDGRDYALTGTWGSDGFTYVWDVTDPADIVLTDSVQVDARTVNDVKASPDGRYATLTREGASDRRNGVVILDMSTPAHPVIATEYDEGLTGGVHNAYPQDDYLYVLSAGEKYLIVEMSDIYNPRTVSEVNIPGSRIHDVWVHDGIAYSAEWATGIVQVDVGNGRWGGSPENPVVVNTFPLPGGNTHAVYPYYQEETGRFYIFAGDEVIGRQGYALEGGNNRAPYDPEVPGSGTPRNTAGYIHIVDYTDPENPQKVARYHVAEYGTHNIWVEDDILYQAYYEGGLRVVDVSGLLKGNLYTQGREIAVFKPNDPTGYVHNAPTTWSAMPFKGNIFLSDANSGLWAVRLEPTQRPIP